ncbi:hypothetical protein ALQ37_101820 [Pseudomonas syringae pv. aptata]|uniref:Uncharacterized protein n=1 Tax=Pseudomonas syringae pv. aptata TaxID=83167 RepID=A0A3M3X9E3_PSEAP|nr:hypothetical protein ALQ37_101820 [Pseudomonas syringae pv. aptata]
MVSDGKQRVDLAVLSIVGRLCFSKPQKLTFGQIYRELVRAYSSAPAIHVCVATVDTLVREGLLISTRVLEPDQSFPYTQHIISGLTEIGAAYSLAERLRRCVDRAARGYSLCGSDR